MDLSVLLTEMESHNYKALVLKGQGNKVTSQQTSQQHDIRFQVVAISSKLAKLINQETQEHSVEKAFH